MVMDRSNFSGPLEAIGYQLLTVDNTSGGVSLTIPDGTRVARCQVQDAEIRWTEDGTAPTTTNGDIGSVYDVFYIAYPNLSGSRFIRTGTTSGKLSIHYYR